MRSAKIGGGFALFAFASAASGASPTPDRPTVSRAGSLVAPNTLELEAGGLWAGDAGAPALLKYAAGDRLELRVGGDLAGVNTRSPGIEAGVKLGLVASDATGLAVWLGSKVPVDRVETWDSSAQLLWTQALDDRWTVQANTGIEVIGREQGGVRFGGVPVVALVSPQLTRHLSVFLEGAALVGGPSGALSRGIVDGGIGWTLTEIVVLDAAFGWDLDARQPFAQLGLTANLGRVE